ncbi:hypothetical protein BC834DRAFT_1042949 [Gloeopeniophorella convolvens]|nr:hypothetical protein BC834DRAFT_1042949 [Gloeopeniophorella convolvens]
METVETRLEHLTVNDAEDDRELPLKRGVQLNPDKVEADLQRYLVSLGRARRWFKEITPELSRRANIRFPKPVENHHQIFGCRITREWISAIGKSITEPHLEKLKLDFVDQSQSVMMGLYYITALTSIPLEIDFAILPSPEPGEELPDIESHLVLDSGDMLKIYGFCASARTTSSCTKGDRRNSRSIGWHNFFSKNQGDESREIVVHEAS